MNFKNFSYCLILVLIIPNVYSQDVNEKQKGHINTNKFRQLYQEFSSPNIYRAASGAPGPAYYQQQADYKINVELDDKNKMIYGDEILPIQTIHHKNLIIYGFSWIKMLEKKIPKFDRDSEQVYLFTYLMTLIRSF